MINGRYKLQERLGIGGMGEVQRVYDRLTETTVALKRVLVNPSSLTFNSKSDTNNDWLALAREFKVLASLRHPNIISVLDYGFDELHVPYFTMDYLEQSQDILNAGENLDTDAQIHLLIQLLQGLTYLHRRGLIHRDLKPSNIMLVNEQLKIIDFGLAIKPDQTQDVAGTLIYIAPEQFEGEKASIASDLYAVGLLAYQLFAKQFPFDRSKTIKELIYDIISEPIDFSGIPASLIPILQQLLHKNPNNRYSNAFEAMTAFNAILANPLPLDTPAIRESYLQAAEFVGRESELRQLTEALPHTPQQKGTIWLVGGESGVGKSRLVDELRPLALVNDIMVFSGQGVEGGGLPYQLWRDVLRHLILTTDIANLEASVLKEIMPDIGKLLGYSVPDIPPLQGQAHQQRLNLTIIAVVKRQKRPLLIILEDLQWTVESRAPLSYLHSEIEGLPVMVVGTYRNDEVLQLPQEIPHTHQLVLPRLDNETISKLTNSILGQTEQNEELIELIQHETEGNVFFVVEVVRALAEEVGNLADIGRHTLPKKVLAGGMQTVIRRRLAGVPDWGQKLLQFAAVAGRHIDLNILRQIAPQILTQHSLTEWLQVCNEAFVLEVNEVHWRFNHDKLRETVLADIDDDARASIHSKVATVIEDVYAAELVPYAEALAHHWRIAENPVKELSALLIAAEPIITVFQNFTQGQHFLERALYLVQSHKTDLVSQLRLYWLLSHAVHLPEAERMAYSEQGYALAKMNNRPDWQHLIGLRMTQGMYDPVRMEALMQPARDYYTVQGDVENRIHAELLLLDAQKHRKNYTEMQRKGEQLYVEIQELGVLRLKTSILLRLSGLARAQGNFQLMIELNNEAYTYAQEEANLSAMASTLINTGIGYNRLGETELSLKTYHEALQIFTQVDNIRGKGIAYVNISEIYVSQADWEQAENTLLEAIRFAKKRGLRETLIPEYLHRVLIVWRETGREAQAGRLLGHFLHSEMEQKHYTEEVAELHASLKHIPNNLIEEGAGLSQSLIIDWILGDSAAFRDGFLDLPSSEQDAEESVVETS